MNRLKWVGRWLALAMISGANQEPLLAAAGLGGVSAESLRCEYRVDPVGLDVVKPRLSWTLNSTQRCQKQTAYQVIVSASLAALSKNQGNRWNSGKVLSDQTIHVVYGGRPLRSRAQAHWKVRVWDKDGRPSAWSPPAQWTMGLLEQADWQAQWIADHAAVTNLVPRSPHNGYHSQLATNAATAKWVQIDLGRPLQVDAVRLFPARPYDWQPDTPGFLFPLRFKVEIATQSNLANARVVVDRTLADEPNPGADAPTYRFAPAPARFVRLTTSLLRLRDATNYGLALAEMQVLAGGWNLAQGAKATALDSIESGAWATANLTDGVLLPVPPDGGPGALPATLVRRSFLLPAPVQKATAYVTALGLYELRLNGQRVGGQLLAPEWTSYRKRIQYQTYDVTGLLREGENAIGALLGEGWYAGRLMAVGRNAYGAYPRFLCQLEVDLSDGRKQVVASDASWRSTADGPIRSSGIYEGETYDARQEMPGWDAGGFADRAWCSVHLSALGPAQLVWQPNEPIRVIKELPTAKLTEPKPGVYVFDLGQNMVGWCRVKARGKPGHTITIRHAETLNDDGTLYTANLRGAPQVDRYIPWSDGEEVFEPHFTYHGFRYVELTGLSQAPGPEAVLGRVFHSSAPEAGEFECSSPLVNQLMRNILWTQRANLMSTPNDCPQRDERFGWMGDIQAFSQTAIFNLDMAAFFNKWVRDLRDDQAEDGRYPDFAPHPGNPNAGFSGTPAWGDAGTVVPWRMYQNYADTRLLAEHFDSARRWVEYIHRLNPDLIWSKGRNNDYNDWLNGDWIKQTGWPNKGGAVPQEVFATAFFAHSTEIVAKMAAVLGRAEEARQYGGLLERIKAAFNRRFVQPDGTIHGDTQAGYALALNFDLVPADRRAALVRHLLAGLQRYQGRLSTGIQTTHRLMLELTRNGHHEAACRLALSRDFPSWGYMIENGATTIWERWDGYVKGRGFQDPGMNSFNHWAFGAVGEWIWRHLAGINPDEASPGYKHFIIAPRPGGDLTWAKAEYRSIRGPIASQWKLDGDTFNLQVAVPPNTTATVYVRAKDASSVTEGGQPAAQAEGVKFVGTEDGFAVFDVESGQYSFTAH
jgi:alpha-L-rhamnosidase